MTRNRLLAVGLFVSLLLNVFLVAYGATLLARQPQPLQALGATPVELGNRIAELLPPDQGTRLRGKLGDIGPAMLGNVRAYRQALQAAAELLKADVVDQQALKLAVRAARDARAEIGNLLTDTFVETAAELSPDERRKLIRRFRLQ